jgi:hypothetical protein
MLPRVRVPVYELHAMMTAIESNVHVAGALSAQPDDLLLQVRR